LIEPLDRHQPHRDPDAISVRAAFRLEISGNENRLSRVRRRLAQIIGHGSLSGHEPFDRLEAADVNCEEEMPYNRAV
jgi:hypothetical protein